MTFGAELFKINDRAFPAHLQLDPVDYLRQANTHLEKITGLFQRGKRSILNFLLEESFVENLNIRHNETGALIANSNKDVLIEQFINGRTSQISEHNLFLAPSEEDKTHFLVKTTLPYLHLINSVEGHKGGNDALQRIPNILRTSWEGETKPIIMHQRGSDFCTGLKCDLEEVERFKSKAIARQWPAISGTTEYPYLLIESIDLADSVEIFNQLQTLRTLANSAELITTPKEASEELLNIGDKLLTFRLGYSKALSLCHGFRERYTAGSATADLEEYFDLHLKPYLQMLDISCLDDCISRFDTHPEVIIQDIAWRRAVQELGR